MRSEVPVRQQIPGLPAADHPAGAPKGHFNRRSAPESLTLALSHTGALDTKPPKTSGNGEVSYPRGRGNAAVGSGTRNLWEVILFLLASLMAIQASTCDCRPVVHSGGGPQSRQLFQRLEVDGSTGISVNLLGREAFMENADKIDELIQRAAQGDEPAMSTLLSMYRDRLTKMVQLRLDRRLFGRVDASDIVQEATIEAARRLREYAETLPMDFYLWLRQLAGQKLIDAHRHHLGAEKRDAGQEVSLYRKAMPEATTTVLASQLLGRLTSPTQALQRAELQLRVQEALNSLDPIDREVLVLRHFEQLSNSETAKVLGISKSAASKRFIVALRRLKEVLNQVTGLEEQF